ncbi:6-phosphofructokinase [Brevibacillus ruminantium]|uniref:Pyrophosphate--fructose 6-phosphate 1-phosphotransferase n=1 Tax=Brevibacillus ruminantium TaxID=2950604 RepID=A0ABY4WKX0_9BACL|nr:6-phosphofructokinase [Brevibacillus ruminantium]USG67813.1 6-phosphofructokinase [Brevibacillus ruminantium]
MTGNCLIAQSGGPTAVINNSLYGIIEESLQSPQIQKVYGARRGVYGLLNQDYIDLGQLSKPQLEMLRMTPGAALGSWRYKLSTHEIEIIVAHMQANDIRYFYYIGGNGSMHVAHLIHQAAQKKGYELNVIGVPKTVDNDLTQTDHSPGFGSAAKFLATSILDMSMDIMSLPKSNRITIVETMGRNTGWLAASCALGMQQETGIPLLIYIPESPFCEEKFLRDVQKKYEQHGSALVIVSEGIRDGAGRLIADSALVRDAVGRPQLGGVAGYLKDVITTQGAGLSARYILPSIWQRSGMMFSSGVDVEEAYLAGKHACYHAKQGINGAMVTLQRKKRPFYAVEYGSVPLKEVAGKEKLFPLEWYDADSHFVKAEFFDYIYPLIQGEVSIPMKNGLPAYQYFIS